MKIAGRKNDGAWHRANRYIKNVDQGGRAALAIAILASDFLPAFIVKMQGIRTELGLDVPALESAEDYATSLSVNGIPRQVWNGKLSYTIYDKVVDGEEVTYVPRGQSETHYFAKDLRRIVTRFMFGQRTIDDIANFGQLGQGNPGGLPNVDPET